MHCETKTLQLLLAGLQRHPWHGLSLGKKAPEVVNCYVEIVPADTVKYELDKRSGLLKVDRPQKYSNLCPALYGFLPKTYCGSHSAAFAMEKTGLKELQGDDDPLDICVLSERPILKGDLLIRAIPIGGFRAIDKGEADDKIIAVLEGDLVYGDLREIADCPQHLIDRLKHYFLTYKSCPNGGESLLKITHTYGQKEAHEVIRRAQKDYEETFPELYQFFEDFDRDAE